MVNYIDCLVDNIKKKWYIIVLCIVICSSLMMGEKLLFNQYTIQNGSVHFESVLKVENKENMTNPYYQDRVKYDQLFQTYAFMNEFIKNTNDKLDYLKLNSGWNNLSQQDKLKWLQKRLIVNNYNDGIIQVVFHLDVTDSKDIEYIQTNAEIISGVIQIEIQKQIKTINENNELKNINHFYVLPEIHAVSKEKVVFKYGILGALLGGIVGLIIIVVVVSKRGKNDN